MTAHYPLYKSPLHEITSPKESNLELWEVMFKFAWMQLNKSSDNATELSSESESSEIEDMQSDSDETDEGENSDDWWPDL